MWRSALSGCVLVILGSACASTPRAEGLGSDGAERTSSASAPRPRRTPEVIGLDELLAPAVRTQNVLEAIRMLRPNFLNNRGKTSQGDPEAGRTHASIDGLGVVSLEELRRLNASVVLEIRFLNLGEAMQRFGGAARQGAVILVRTM